MIFSWIKWERISLKNRWDGWGIKDLYTFSRVLATKVGCRLITTTSIWTRIIIRKYTYILSLIEWIRL